MVMLQLTMSDGLFVFVRIGPMDIARRENPMDAKMEMDQRIILSSLEGQHLSAVSKGGSWTSPSWSE